MPHEPLDRTAETDALLAMAVDALNRAPIIGSTREDARAFETRQNAWLRDVYNPTLAAIRAERTRAGGVKATAPLIAAMEAAAEALAKLIEQTVSCEKELTEQLYREEFCGESLPLCSARAALTDLRTHIENAKGGEEE